MANVQLDLRGTPLTAAITKEAVAELNLSVGDAVIALIKSTEVSLATT